MTTKSSVGDTTLNVGDVNESKTEKSEAENQLKEREAKENTPYYKAITEAKKLKERVRSLETEKESRELKQLAENQEWKQLADTYKSRFEETEKLLKEKEDNISKRVKYEAFKKSLGGDLVSDDFLSHAPLDRIVLNPETGEVDSVSAKEAASEFLKKYPYLVNFNKTKIPTVGATQVNSTSKTLKDMTKEEIEEQLNKLARS